MNQALNLFRLQTLDTQINHIDNRLNEIDLILKQDKAVKQALMKLEESKQELNKRRIELKQSENLVEIQQLKLKRSQANLFSGKIKNPKELQDLQQESEALRRYISKLEDDQLACMIIFEEAQQKSKSAEDQHKQAQENKASQNASLLGEKMRLEKTLSNLIPQRQAVISGISAEALNLYQGLLKSKNGLAVAEVLDNGCSACGSTLTPGELQSARSPNTLLHCANCGRILFKP